MHRATASANNYALVDSVEEHDSGVFSDEEDSVSTVVDRDDSDSGSASASVTGRDEHGNIHHRDDNASF